MKTIVKLLGWESVGLRCPDHKVTFERSAGSTFALSLIQMPNGTGKTTALQLLRAALSGSAIADQGWTAQKIISLRKKDPEARQGEFRVSLMVGDKQLTISMRFDFEEGRVKYATTYGAGLREGFHPPREVLRFLRPGFVEFFVFDGELAERLLDHEFTDARTVIEDLFQLKLFASIESRIQEYWDGQTANAGATEVRGLNRRRNRVSSLKERVRTLKSQRAQADKSYQEHSAILEKKRSRFDRALEEERATGDAVRQADQHLNDAKAEVTKDAATAFSMMRSPYAVSAVFAQEMVELKGGLDKVKLPESTAREFFEELAEEDSCICGRPLDDETRQIVRDRASEYLGTDDVALLNAMKSDISSLVGEGHEDYEAELDATLASLSDAMRREDEARTHRDEIEAKAIQDDPSLEAAKVEIRQLEVQVKTDEAILARFDDPTDVAGDEMTFGIDVLERRLNDAERKLAEITQTIELRAKRDVLRRILVRAVELAREGLGAEIVEQTNLRLSSLMPYNSIRVSGIKQCLELQGQEGGSVGETLSVAYGFLATLFNRTEHQLPFVVDSPAGPIDVAVRGKVAELIPQLTEQFIAFTISSEREGFIDPLEKVAAGEIQYLTLFRKGSPELEEAARRAGGVVETSDGICVPGGAFFRSFHTNEEE